MEKFKSTYDQSITSEVLYNLTSEIIVLINTYVKDNNFVLSGTSLEKYVDECLKIKNISTLNGRKKLFYKLKYFYHKPTLKKANLLLHYLNKQVLCTNFPATKIDISVTEKKIQDKKFLWKEVKAMEETAHKEYLEAKGDFYKTNRRVASWL